MATLSKDANNSTVQLFPAGPALARTVDTSISSSTEITLNAATTFIRVLAGAAPVYMKWGADDVTASNFDEVIPANQICDFMVPIETQPSTLYTAVNFIESATSGITVIEK